MQFIKNILDADIDPVKREVEYKILAMYDDVGKDGVADIEIKTVASFTMTFDEINKNGGVGAVTKGIKKRYNIGED